MHEIPDLKIIPGLSPDDPFAPHNVQLTPDDVVVGVKAIVHIPVKKPKGMGFFRVHPSIAINTVLLEHDKELFYVAPGMRAHIEEGKPHTLFFCLSRTGSPFRVAGAASRRNRKIKSVVGKRARSCRTRQDQMVRCWANQRDNTYDVVMATAPIPDPKWPDLDVAGIMRLRIQDPFDRQPRPRRVESAPGGGVMCAKSG